MTQQNCMCGKGKMHMEIMHILLLNWFAQESDNLAPDIQGTSGWHLAEWSLSVVLKAVQLAFKMSLFVFKESNPQLPIGFFVPEDPKC